MAESSGREPLPEDQVEIVVPKGLGDKVRIVEAEAEGPAEITVRISKERKLTRVPVLGVIVK